MENYIWLIPALPLAGLLINIILGRYFEKQVHWIACGTVLGSFLVSLKAFMEVWGGKTLNYNYFDWIQVGTFKTWFGVQVDALSAIMLLVVTGVGFLIHIYSIGYMHGDPWYRRFFIYLNLFIFSMVNLVLANNFLLLYVFWEAVGLCSYLLIGFWFNKKSAADAGKKAFIVNRVGDFGFGLGIMLIFVTFGTLQYDQVFSSVGGVGTGVITAITLLLMLGAMGKSAQIPLYVWLPDAMEGPTPVSALIHAATMVTAGVYMIARCHVLFDLAPITQNAVVWMGTLTAFFAATIALIQKDIKRVLAYSTISQLGYMFVAVGLGAYGAGIFHLATHAFFKALLFLGAGSVMHAMANETDMWKMGGLGKIMKNTCWTFWVACLAIAGIPPFAGFFSKEEILTAAFTKQEYLVYAICLLTALLTSFYMFRAFYLTFKGKPRYDTQSHHAHESPSVMTIPLMILGVLSIFGGLVMGWKFKEGSFINNFLSPVFSNTAHEAAHGHGESMTMMVVLIVLAVGVAFIGLLAARFFYVRNLKLTETLTEKLAIPHRILTNKYYVDEFYNWAIIQPVKRISIALWKGFDTLVIDGIVNGIGWTTSGVGQLLRFFQSGYVRTYATLFVVGVIAVLGFFLTR